MVTWQFRLCFTTYAKCTFMFIQNVSQEKVTLCVICRVLYEKNWCIYIFSPLLILLRTHRDGENGWIWANRSQILTQANCLWVSLRVTTSRRNPSLFIDMLLCYTNNNCIKLTLLIFKCGSCVSSYILEPLSLIHCSLPNTHQQKVYRAQDKLTHTVLLYCNAMHTWII